jgi:hypothetical protein
MFTVDQVYNRRNDRVIIDQGTPAPPVNRTKHPAGVMMLGIVASNGWKCQPIFIPSGLKVNTEVYISLLRDNLLPWLRKNYPDGNYVFQGRGAGPYQQEDARVDVPELGLLLVEGRLAAQ